MPYMIPEHHLHIEIDAKECRIPEDALARIQPKLTQLGQAVHDLARSELWLTVVYHPRSQIYHAQAKLKLPGQTIITGDRNQALDTALLQCLDKVIRRVEAYKANPDEEALRRAKRQTQLSEGVVAPIEPDAGRLGDAFMRGDYEAFRRALVSHEELVRRRVGRWIQRYPEIQRQVGESFEIADMVEEVFLTAFDQYGERPKHLSIHEWLERMIDPAINAFWNDPADRQAASFAQTLAGAPRT